MVYRPSRALHSLLRSSNFSTTLFLAQLSFRFKIGLRLDDYFSIVDKFLSSKQFLEVGVLEKVADNQDRRTRCIRQQFETVLLAFSWIRKKLHCLVCELSRHPCSGYPNILERYVQHVPLISLECQLSRSISFYGHPKSF